MKDNLLVTLADRNFIDQAKQLFSSVYWNAGWKGDYMLLAHKIPEKDLKWFRDKGILVKKCKPLYNKGWGDEISKWPPILLDKFYLFTPEFKKWKNIVYLDADIIVRGSLDKISIIKGLCATDVGKTQKLSNLLRRDNKLFIELNKNINLSESSFNAGVLAFSTDIINNKTFNHLKLLFRKYKKISSHGEESILNIYFYNKWRKLFLIYDIYPTVLIRYYNFNPKKIKGICLHFIRLNNHNTRCWDKENYFYEEWKSNLDKAEFIDLNNIPEGKKWGSIKIQICSLSIIICLKFKKILHFIKYAPNKILGKVGIFLRKYNPQIYIKLKKYF